MDAVFVEVARNGAVGGTGGALLPQSALEGAAKSTVGKGENSGLAHQVYKILVDPTEVKDQPRESSLWTIDKKLAKLRAVAKHRLTLGEVLVGAHVAMEEPMSFEQIARRLEDHGVSVSFQTVINYHDDAVAKPSVEIVQALVDFYGLSLGDLPDDLRARCERLRDRLVAASGPPTHGSRSSTCNSAESQTISPVAA